MEISYKDKFHKDFFASLRFVKMWFAIFFLRFDLATNWQLCHVFAHSNVRRDSRRALRFYSRLFYIYVKNV